MNSAFPSASGSMSLHSPSSIDNDPSRVQTPLRAYVFLHIVSNSLVRKTVTFSPYFRKEERETWRCDALFEKITMGNTELH